MPATFLEGYRIRNNLVKEIQNTDRVFDTDISIYTFILNSSSCDIFAWFILKYDWAAEQLIISSCIGSD